MSDWTEGRTWTRVVRGECRDMDGWLHVRQSDGGPYYWEVVMVEVERPSEGSAATLREAKTAAHAEWLAMVGRYVRARGGL